MYEDGIRILGETEDNVRLIYSWNSIGKLTNKKQIFNNDLKGYQILNISVDINHQENSHKEIIRRKTTGIRCYFSLVPQFKSKLLSKKKKKMKIRLYKVLIGPIVLYACEAKASTKSNKKIYSIRKKNCI